MFWEAVWQHARKQRRWGLLRCTAHVFGRTHSPCQTLGASVLQCYLICSPLRDVFGRFPGMVHNHNGFTALHYCFECLQAGFFQKVPFDIANRFLVTF